MTDSSGCLWYFIAALVLGGCIELSKALNISILLMFFFVFLFAIICFGIVIIYYHFEDKYKERLKARVSNSIQKEYPRAYILYLKKNGYSAFGEKTPTIDLYMEILRRDKSIWQKEEIEINDKITRERHDLLLKSLGDKYPQALLYYQEKHPDCSDDELRKKELALAELEQTLFRINHYRKWAKNQDLCNNETYDRLRPDYSSWDYHEHLIPTIIECEEASDAFILSVPHIRIWLYSSVESVDESFFPIYKTRAQTIPFVEKCGGKIKPSIVKKLFSFVKQYSNPIVAFADSGRSESFPNLNQFHFSFLRKLLDKESIPYGDVSDGSFLREAVDKTIIIIELISSSETVSVNSTRIIPSLHCECRLLYISLWYELSSREISSITEQKDSVRSTSFDDCGTRQRNNETSPLLIQENSLVLKRNYQQFKEYLAANDVHYLYHFTDSRNLDSIRDNGGLFSWKYCEENAITIESPGGDEMSRCLDTKHQLEDYVRLSFCSDHPMSYRLKQEGNELVLLKIKIDVAWLQGTLFSDINATDNSHHHGPSLEDLKRIDINATRMHYVANTSEFFKKHQAEVLVKTCVPLEYIVNIDNPDLI